MVRYCFRRNRGQVVIDLGQVLDRWLVKDEGCVRWRGNEMVSLDANEICEKCIGYVGVNRREMITIAFDKSVQSEEAHL